MFDPLIDYRRRTGDASIMALFEADPDRFERYSAHQDDMLLDYSKTAIDDAARGLLLNLFEERGVAARRDAMFRGDPINVTEHRAVLHTALRDGGTTPIRVDGADVLPGVRETLSRMQAFSDGVRRGTIATQAGPFTDVVNVGIGGSDLGPVMATLALAPYHDGPRTHFVSNIDGAHAADILAGLDPRRTLVIVASKTFTTIETMTNAATIRAWLESGGGDPSAQFVALSSALERTNEFGIPPDRVFGFEDWVGGRYSVWGPIGLSLTLAIGPEQFSRFLDGAHVMDRHFREAAPQDNMPVMLALIGIWHRNICGYPSRAVLPYDQRLARLPAYLQQLDMESNGKSVSRDGAPVEFETGPIVWGEPGTNGQHAFYQLIHQGTSVIPCEFIVAAQGHEEKLGHHHALLLANCLAQSEALLRGRGFDAARRIVSGKGITHDVEAQSRQRVFPGNRPSTTLLYRTLDPYTLGRIIALYEHRVFVEGAIWGINSFDQWGVELGKELATGLLPVIEGKIAPDDKDGSTAGLVSRVQSLRGT